MKQTKINWTLESRVKEGKTKAKWGYIFFFLKTEISTKKDFEQIKIEKER